MLNKAKLKTLFLFFMMGNTLLFSASLSEKKFDVKTGMVTFDIIGAGQITDDVNISIKGRGQLRFRDWGVEALLEEEYEEITSGAINDINKIQLCEKFENKQRFDVDFKTEKILERPMPKGNFKTYYLKDMVKAGEEKVAGYTCDVWEGKGIKKCLYKGVPLLIEYYVFGIYYQKKAVTVKLDIAPSPSKCTLPNFPVEKFALFKTSIKTKSPKLPKELSQVILNINKEISKMGKNEDDLSPHQKRTLLNKIGHNIFVKQKNFLPELLATMKEARMCLQQIESKDDANVCLSAVVEMKSKVSKNVDNSVDAWSPKEKNIILDHFEDKILFLESKMKCIRTSQNISDLSNCMK